MSNMSWHKEVSVARLVLADGENRFNPEFVADLLKRLDEIEKDEDIKALVIESHKEKHWALGIDINWALAVLAKPEKHSELKRFMFALDKLFVRLLTYPVPVIAAIDGNVEGTGAVMACACDYRLMRLDKGNFSFPDINMGFRFLPGMWAIAKKAMPGYMAEDLVLTGRRVQAIELEDNFCIKKACGNVTLLLEEAIALAKTFDKKRNSFAEMKKVINKSVIEVIEKEDPELIESLKMFA